MFLQMIGAPLSNNVAPSPEAALRATLRRCRAAQGRRASDRRRRVARSAASGAPLGYCRDRLRQYRI